MTVLTPYQISALNYNEHISLTANAGSGKTFVLAKRFVEIAVSEDVPLSAIVAITFTDKAASELYKKIAGEIESRLELETDINIKHKLRILRRSLVSAKISTIHSFCSELLKEFSPEAGLDAGFTLIDQDSANEFIEKEITDYVLSGINSENGDSLKYIIRVLGSNQSFLGEVKKALNKIKTIRDLAEEIYSGDNDSIKNHFRDNFERLFVKVVDSKFKVVYPEIERINSQVLILDGKNERANSIKQNLDSYQTAESIGDKLRILSSIKSELLTNKLELRKQGYLKDLVNRFPDEALLIQKFFETLEFFDTVDFQNDNYDALAEFGKIFIAIVLEIYSNYNKMKSKYGYLDYEDLLSHTEKIIRNRNVRELLSAKYKYIMIDEFQDTNETQFNIFIPILDYLNLGNLFVVGDEKQSIYMFRDAELKIFEKTKGIIKTKSAETGILELPHSFRVSPKIALFCNQVFARLFADPDLFFNEVQNSNLVSTRDDFETGVIELLFATENTPQNESDLVAAKILELAKEKSLKYNDIAVLVRKRNSFNDLEKSFLKYNIPYNIVGGKGFYQQQVVYDVYSYLSFLIDRNNDTSLFAILRSPFFNFPDNLLYHVSLLKENSLWEKLNSSVELKQFATCVEIINRHIGLTRKVDLAELIRLVLKDTGYLSVIASRYNSKQELANINKLLEIAKNFSKHNFKNIFDFVDKLKISIEQGQDEGQGIIPEEDESVNLMTIHQSKGLEYKAVFIFNCGEKTNSDTVKSRSVSIDKEYGLLTKLPPANDYFQEYQSSPIIGAANYKNMRKNTAEMKRLFYVAVTRAVDYLFISGTLSKSINKQSFLHLLKEGLDLVEFPESIVMQGELELMKQHEDQYVFSSEPVKLNIPVISDIEIEEKIEISKNILLPEDLIVDISEIQGSTKNEIVSATKINLYSQCPLKYHLTYNLGYTEIFKTFYFKQADFYKSREDDELKYSSDLKGRIIHSLLEKAIPLSEIEDAINSFLLLEGENTQSHIPAKELIPEIKTTLENYYASDVYKDICSFTKFHNEFEIYLKEDDYYLYGIIDRIMFNDEKTIIVDYKTDRVTENNSAAKYSYYKNQLMFYAYLASKYFKTANSVQLKLVFVNNPQLSKSEEISTDEIVEFGGKIKNIIANIRRNLYPQNISHCDDCHFFINNKCVAI